MKFSIILAVLAIIGFIVGREIRDTYRPDSEKVVDQKILSIESGPEAILKDEATSKNIESKKEEIKSEDFKEEVDQFNALVKKSGYDERLTNMQKAFGDDALSQTLIKTLTLIASHEMAGSEESRFVDEQLEILRDAPIDALEKLKDAIPKIIEEDVSTVQTLIQYLAKYGDEKEEKLRELAEIAKLDPQAEKSGDQRNFTPVIAFMALSFTGAKPEEVKSYYNEIVNAHKGNPAISVMIEQEYKNLVDSKK